MPEQVNTIAIIVLNWNGKSLVEHCLPSVLGQTYKHIRLLFVDNGSTDGSVEYVREHFSAVEIIALDHNTGFAYANNVAIAQALKDSSVSAVVTLNNDTELAPTCIEELFAATQRHPEAGAVQGKVRNFYKRQQIDSAGILIYPDMSAINRGQKEQDHGQFDTEEEVFGVSASAALYTRAALEATKLSTDEFFDNSYFAYYEDVDLAWRIRLAGLSAYLAPKALVYHVHSATAVSHSPFKAFHIHRNQYYNIIKDLPLRFLLLALLRMPVRYFLLLSSVFRKRGASAELKKKTSGGGIVKLVLGSWKDIIIHFPSLLRKRWQIQQQRRVPVRQVGHWFRDYRADINKIIYG
ncbi:MAG: glycosyltransferase family 2 protein [Candidatus Kerfeldbacteria bacterium]|nr:glycosyltransferase family 2 protein [Candidatus Kerfeldbacteria bacterium]